MAYLNPPPPYNGPHGDKVVLYATDWCGYCAKARTFLKDNNIPYVEFDIEKSTEGRAEYEKLGGNGIPLLLVRGNVVRGYSPDEIKHFLTQ